MTGSDLEQVPESGAELEPLSPEEQALAEGVKGSIDSKSLVLPAIKLTHGLTKEVENGEVDEGVYINSLTKEQFGDDVPFVVCGIYPGRFYNDSTGTYVARTDVAPDNWPEEYAGRPFADIEDAEECWKADANAGVHPFGKGPPIATTANFVGFVVGQDDELPLRLSLMRTSMPAANKLKTMIYGLRAPWDRVFQLRVSKGTNSEGRSFYKSEVASGAPISKDDRQKAIKIAQDFRNAQESGAIEETGDAADSSGKAGKPAARKDSLDVG